MSRQEAPEPIADAPGTLAALLAYIAEQAPQPQHGSGSSHGSSQMVASGVDPALIEYFRGVWSSLGTRRLLRQSQAQVPANAGPLNSQNLVHRSLVMMRELSPGYLEHFLSYADALSWMEQLNDDGNFGKAGGQAATRTRKTRR